MVCGLAGYVTRRGDLLHTIGRKPDALPQSKHF